MAYFTIAEINTELEKANLDPRLMPFAAELLHRETGGHIDADLPHLARAMAEGARQLDAAIRAKHAARGEAPARARALA